MKTIFFSEALRMLHYSLSKKILGIPVYKGDSEKICETIIDRCWNGRYFMTSAGHFCQFYTRDFAWCIKPLIRLGHKEEVRRTLNYALTNFERKKMIAAALSPAGTPFDFPTYAIDSLPYLTYSLVQLGDNELVNKYSSLIDKEVERFMTIVVDGRTGLVKAKHFSSAKDHAVRSSSCYDVAMAGMLSQNLEKLGLHNPLSKYDYKRLLLKHFWKKRAFVDDLSSGNVISGDANVFPYWCGIVRDKAMLRSSANAIREHGLEKPFPLKYSDTKPKTILTDVLTPNYQGNSIWTYLGLLFIDTLSTVDERLALYYLVKYGRIIERYGNFLEVFEPDGRPYSTAFYMTDDSMLWASLYLDLVKRLR